MRRVGLLAGLLVLALGSGVVAQSPSPPPWFGGRVEMPEHGFAVTLPDGWVGFDTAADAMSQRDAASGVLDPALWKNTDAEWVDGLASAASAGYRLWAGHATKEESCGLGTWRSNVSLGDEANRVFEWYSNDPDTREVAPPQLVDLPAGPAYHIRMTRLAGPDPDDWWPLSHYLLGTDGVLLQVYCVTDDIDRDEGWPSIVETIEVWPLAGPWSPPWLGGRVEMPKHGFAVTLPHDWVSFDTAAVTAGQVEAALGVLDPAVWSTDVAGWVDGFAEQASDGFPLWSAHIASSTACQLGRSTPDESLLDAADYHREWYTDDPDTRDVEPRLIDLPTGTAHRIRMTHRDGPDSDDWWPAVHYTLDSDGTSFEAYCWSYDARPDDDWLSIVETFEFLPVEE